MITTKRTDYGLTAMQYCSLLTVLYALLIFIVPANQTTMQTYHLSPLEYRIILSAVQLPSVLVWFAAFWGYAALYQYAHSLRETAEEAPFRQLAHGAAWLAWSSPIPLIASIALNGIASHWPGFHHTAIIIINYISLIIPLVAFSILADASRNLANTAKLRFSLIGPRLIMLIFLIIGVLYCYLTFRRFNLASLTSTHNPYFLPVWLMVISVTIPYLYAWFVGLLGAYELRMFSKNVQGVLYRRGLGYLVVGMGAVIVSSIALQYISSVQPRIGHLVFDYRLLLTTVFRVIGGAGFLALAIGANRLKKIEEI
jgi:hypothetical protein